MVNPTDKEALLTEYRERVSIMLTGLYQIKNGITTGYAKHDPQKIAVETLEKQQNAIKSTGAQTSQQPRQGNEKQSKSHVHGTDDIEVLLGGRISGL